MNNERPWTYDDLSAYTGLKVGTLRVMGCQGDLPNSMGFGKSRRFDPSVAREWFRKRLQRIAARAGTGKAVATRKRTVRASVAARAQTA